MKGENALLCLPRSRLSHLKYLKQFLFILLPSTVLEISLEAPSLVSNVSCRICGSFVVASEFCENLKKKIKPISVFYNVRKDENEIDTKGFSKFPATYFRLFKKNPQLIQNFGRPTGFKV